MTVPHLAPRSSPGFGLALCIAGAAAIVLVSGTPTVATLTSADLAAVLAFAAGAVAATGAAANSAAPRGAAANAVTIWLLSIALLGLLYGHRAGLGDVAAGAWDELGVGSVQTAVTVPGEVTITRRGSGFVVPARIGDRDVRFIFDTGASTVVLTHDTAALIGLKPDTLRYRVPVGTANGSALAAPVTLPRLSVGTITMERVPALVVRPGMLAENLLGMSFLERLASYEVRGNKLVLRAVKT